MSGDDTNFVLCYNRGCGERFDPAKNDSDSCRHHSGFPVFHDAYKSWSCCKKKSTDFTEFLNFKGCTLSCHSNIKPPEPEKPKTQLVDRPTLETSSSPPKDSSSISNKLVKLPVEVTQSLKEQLSNLKLSTCDESVTRDSGPTSVPPGTACKNNTCKAVYENEESNSSPCVHHPGCPIFHEGLKFWSCCNKRTTDFNVFLEQVGCQTGHHLWFKKKSGSETEAKCRLDWHQTGKEMVVTIYCKKCDPSASDVQASSNRLILDLYFPEQGVSFSRDIALQGLIDTEKSLVTYSPTKVEISLGKAVAMTWKRLDNPPATVAPNTASDAPATKDTKDTSPVESVDLSCL